MIPEPQAIGLPPKFQEWRHFQDVSILEVVSSPADILVQAQPTGVGKSVAYIASALLAGSRAVVLTSTKGLQNQLMQDFAKIGMRDIRGMVSYPCKLNTKYRCDDGACHQGFYCQYRDFGCHYYDAVRDAKEAQLVVTNYHYWLYANKYGEGFGDIDLLVLDEAHDAPETMMEFLTITLNKAEYHALVKQDAPILGQDIDKWKEWAALIMPLVYEDYIGTQKEMRESPDPMDSGPARRGRRLKKLLDTLQDILHLFGEWYIEYKPESIKFHPIRVTGKHTYRYLFKSIPKVVLVSATIRPKTMQLLGIGSDSYTFTEYPSVFPVEQRPVYSIPTVKMNRHTSERDMQKWARRIDEIIEGRSDRKGIVHTHSYKRRDYLYDHTANANIMYTNRTMGLGTTVDAFKETLPPAVLVSPSVATGYDFPGDQCRYQIITKIPFPDIGSPVMKKRMEKDRQLVDYMAMQLLVQACGRGVRSPGDFCETFIIDANFRWWFRGSKRLAPSWFAEAIMNRTKVPKAPNLD